MRDKTPVAELSQKAVQRATAALRTAARKPEHPAAPGDVFVLQQTSRQPVQWVILARDPGRPDQLLAALADANPLVGSQDIPVEDEDLGPLVIRRPLGGWIDAATFPPELCVGTLRSSTLETARRLWFTETIHQTPTARGVDQDPEYRHWKTSVLQSAYRCLFVPLAEPLDQPITSSPPPTAPRLQRFALAAGITLALGSLLLLLFSQHRQMRALAGKLAAADQEHSAEIARVEEMHRSDLERLEKENARERARSDATESKLEKTSQEKSVLEKQVEELIRNSTQRAAEAFVTNSRIHYLANELSQHEIYLSTESSHLVLVFTEDIQPTPPSYRISLFRSERQEPEWISALLRPSPAGQILVGIPMFALEPGAYRAELELATGDSFQSSGTYELILRSDDEDL